MSSRSGGALRRVAGAVVATALASASGLGLSGCGGDDPKPTAEKSSSSSPSPSTTYPTPAAAPAKGTQQSASGYSYRLPRDWEDTTSSIKGKGLETGGRAPRVGGTITANLNTVVTASKVEGTPTEKDVAALQQTLKRQIVEVSPNVKPGRTISLDGAPAVSQEGPATSEGTKFYLVQYFAMHEGANYGITFGFPVEATKAQREKVVQAVLASWTWS